MKSLEKGSKMVSRREMLKVSAVAAAAATLAACAQPVAPAAPAAPPAEAPEPEEAAPSEAPAPAPATGNVVIMHFRHEFTEEQEAQFEEENPGITVEFVDATEPARFFAMYAAGTPPDLYRVQAPSIPQFLARGLLYDLTPYFENSELIDMDDLASFNRYYMAESPLEIGSGNIYGMCKDASPDLTMFINTAMFEEAGLPVPSDEEAMPYDNLMEVSEAMTIFEGDRLIQEGYAYENSWVDRIWMVMLAESGENLYSDDYSKIVLLDNPNAQAIIKWYYDMAEKKLSYSPKNPSPSGWFGNDFLSNLLAVAQYGFWFSAMAESDNNRGNVMMLPAATWTGKRMDPTITSTGMIMTAATQVPDAAWKLFEWYNAGEPAVERAKSGWGVPALKSMWPLIPQETDFQKQANKVLNVELALDTSPIQFNPFLGESQVADSWVKNLDLALNGDLTFDEMLTNIESEVNIAISEGIDRIMG